MAIVPRFLWAVAAAVLAPLVSPLAQDTLASSTTPNTPIFPLITQTRQATSASVPYTMSEWRNRMSVEMRSFSLVDRAYNDTSLTMDSILSISARLARGRLTNMENGAGARGMSGIQLDAYATMLVAANRIEDARLAVATRLKEPGVTIFDSASTLFFAIGAFGDEYHPELIPIAEQYMVRLDSMSPRVATWQFFAHRLLADTYDMLGNDSLLLRHATSALELVPELFFSKREWFYSSNTYVQLARVLKGTPEGRMKLAAIDKRLAQWAKPSDSLLALRPSFAGTSKKYMSSLQSRKAFAALWGAPAPALKAMTWLNVKDTANLERNVSPGTISLICFCTFGELLPLGLQTVERLAATFPGKVQPMLFLATRGKWGTALVEPKEEIEYLKNFFTKVRPTAMPIGIWAGEKRKTKNGGKIPEESPTIKAYHGSTFSLTVIDGEGKIRYIFQDVNSAELKGPAVLRKLINNREVSR